MSEKCASPRCTWTTANSSMMCRLMAPTDHKWTGKALCQWHLGRLARRIWKANPLADVLAQDIERAATRGTAAAGGADG